jgi:hypothetical protein
VLTFASVGQAVWGFVPLATLAWTMGGPLAVLALARGIPRRTSRTRLSSMVVAAYSMLGMLAIGGAFMTYVAAVAVTAVARRVADGVDAAGLLATPGAILFGFAAGYVIWRAAAERITLLAHTVIEPPQQIHGTWANNLSTPALLYQVDPRHMHNLYNVESPVLGILATIVSTVLTALLLTAWAIATRDARRRRRTGSSEFASH